MNHTQASSSPTPQQTGPKLLDQMRNVLRMKHDSKRTEFLCEPPVVLT